jgi:hypothetical protein
MLVVQSASVPNKILLKLSILLDKTKSPKQKHKAFNLFQPWY